MAGEISRPNAIQRLLHRFFMLRPVTAFFAPRVHHIDTVILKLTKGRLSGSGILGWPIIRITTTGAKTKQPRIIPLVGMFDREKIALIASSFGRDHNPGWYYNLKAYPECDVEFQGRWGKYLARELDGDEYEHYWNLAVSYYAGYERYQQRAVRRHIPVLLLEPQR
jgi:deazaflavin-dependent oxidoreductase (nitroreductase family)